MERHFKKYYDTLDAELEDKFIALDDFAIALDEVRERKDMDHLLADERDRLDSEDEDWD